MRNTLADLSNCDDIGSLESALRTLCTGFGPVSRLDVLPLVGGGRRQAVCLLRLNSTDRQHDLMTKLGAVQFGDDVCVIVDLRIPD